MRTYQSWHFSRLGEPLQNLAHGENDLVSDMILLQIQQSFPMEPCKRN